MPMTGRIVRSADFQRVLAAPAKARSEHFAVHHLPALPSRPRRPAPRVRKRELSTGDAPLTVATVDDFGRATAAPPETPFAAWFGLVVPKRHAKRSVTRSLFKRQIRAAIERRAVGLPAGLWIVRLRAPFDKARYSSAASTALRQAARAELDPLIANAIERVVPKRPAAAA